MKVIAALALLSVALASPVAVPEPYVLPEPAQPAYETAEFAAIPEPIDISPLFVPVEIVQALKLNEVNPESVIFVEVAENIEYEPIALASQVEEEFPAFGVNVVEVAEGLDVSEDAAPLAEEVDGTAVHFVEVAENIDNAEVTRAEEADGSAVNFVDVAENIEYAEVAPLAEEVDGSAVHFVEVAENIDNAEVARAETEVDGSAVNFVEVAENIEVAPVAEEVDGSAVNFVEVAENIDNAEVASFAEEIPADAVKVVDIAAEDQAVAEEASAFAAELGSQVHFVEVAENIDVEEPAVRAEEIAADAVKVADFAENVESAPVAEPLADSVRVVDAPLNYPGKLYDNPMLR
ncbi:uncharacterized protein LOC113504958 [Trichoplusia ni]|uniref:Uncharacterized protein LOC113504958 n=1 Tax=Trichoplusia ni TaxID=7111 RepID=A0A7E5WSK2_TRINI|nr:uncharacterized protein LOC113504958 [Trichoplusia ni]